MRDDLDLTGGGEGGGEGVHGACVGVDADADNEQTQLLSLAMTNVLGEVSERASASDEGESHREGTERLRKRTHKTAKVCVCVFVRDCKHTSDHKNDRLGCMYLFSSDINGVVGRRN